MSPINEELNEIASNLRALVINLEQALTEHFEHKTRDDPRAVKFGLFGNETHEKVKNYVNLIKQQRDQVNKLAMLDKIRADNGLNENHYKANETRVRKYLEIV